MVSEMMTLPIISGDRSLDTAEAPRAGLLLLLPSSAGGSRSASATLNKERAATQ